MLSATFGEILRRPRVKIALTLACAATGTYMFLKAFIAEVEAEGTLAPALPNAPELLRLVAVAYLCVSVLFFLAGGMIWKWPLSSVEKGFRLRGVLLTAAVLASLSAVAMVAIISVNVYFH